MAASSLQVLLVDDTTCVRELLHAELAPLANVSSAASPEEAFMRISGRRAPDLLICDYRMARMNGTELADRMRRENPRTAVVMLASRMDRERASAGWDGAVDEVIEKPFFASEAARRIKRILDRLSANTSMTGRGADHLVRGTLAQMSVVDLLQSLEMGRKTCLLELENGDQRCEIYFAEGSVEDAAFGPHRGDEAVYEVLPWTKGAFTIDFSKSPATRTTTRSTQGILLEGLRLLDERQRDLGSIEAN